MSEVAEKLCEETYKALSDCDCKNSTVKKSMARLENMSILSVFLELHKFIELSSNIVGCPSKIFSKENLELAVDELVLQDDYLNTMHSPKDVCMHIFVICKSLHEDQVYMKKERLKMQREELKKAEKELK